MAKQNQYKSKKTTSIQIKGKWTQLKKICLYIYQDK